MTGMFRAWGTSVPRSTSGYLSALLWIIAAVVVVWPVVALVIGTLWDSAVGMDPNWGFGAFQRAVNSPRFFPALLTTALFCILVVPSSVFLALILATLSQFSNARLRWLISPTLIISYTIPPLFYSVGYALVGTGRAGAGNDLLSYLAGTSFTPLNLTSFAGLIFVSILRATAYVYILLVGPLSTVGQSQDEAARIAGGGSWVRLTMLVSTLKPSIAAATVLVTIGTVQVFDAVYILGSNVNIYTLSTLTYGLLQQQQADFPAATAIGTMLLALVAVLILLQNFATRSGRFTTVAVKPEARLRLSLGPWRPVFEIFIVLYFVFSLLVPVCSLLVTSVIPFPGVYNSFTFANYTRIWSDTTILHAAMTTFILANSGAVAAVVFAMMMIRLRARQARESGRVLVDVIMLAPKVMHGIVTALAFIWAVTIFSATRGLYGTGFLMFLALTVSVVPVSYLLISSAYAQVDSSLEHAARISGSHPLHAQLRIQVPLLAPTLANAWFLSAVFIAGSLDIPLVLGSVNLRVIATTVFELYSLSGDYGAAAALLVSMLIVFAITALLVRGFVLLIRADLRPWRSARTRPALAQGGVTA
ncbi:MULTISPECIES: ABC transporter permease [Chelativorans]|jgi:iron(III) transport system permease protein|uniref:Binding-protein-dependent transport systems inner membrane component n=1 Tax=Chelativorans sp. (strain BNC1) TaxID=266779 RepID=Q11EY8_CHESB|nr:MULTISPECIES: ABC transporter permease subunit [Chelativorans]